MEQKFLKRKDKFSPIDLAFLIRSGNENIKILASNLYLENNYKDKMNAEEKMDVLSYTGLLPLASDIFLDIDATNNKEEFKDACFCILKNENLSNFEKESLFESKKIKKEMNDKNFFSKREKEILNISSSSFSEIYL